MQNEAIKLLVQEWKEYVKEMYDYHIKNAADGRIVESVFPTTLNAADFMVWLSKKYDK